MPSIDHALLRRITWAVDAVHENSALREKTVKALRALTRSWNVTIEPVFVRSPKEFVFPSEMLIALGAPAVRAEERLKDFLKGVELPGVTAPTYLDQAETSIIRGSGQSFDQVSFVHGKPQ